MRLSEKYLQLNIVTEMLDGESWSAYEREMVHLENVRKYGHICGLESVVES
jgi:hypothetical protein